jgi:serpin B
VALVNTVYLKARWASTFDPRKTKPRDFTLPKGSTLKLPMMSQSGAFNYADNDSWQCLELPLQGGEATMLFLLPRDNAAMAKVETQLRSDTWQAVVGELEDCDVNLMLPRFSFSSELSMTSMWQFLGARLVFEEGKADLSGLVQDRHYFAKEVVHQAMIEVNEIGAEAAAATMAPADPFGSSIATPQRRRVTFIANRPFLWMITHRSSGLILFMGRFAGQ